MEPVRVNLAPLMRFRDRITQGLAGGGDDNPVRRALHQWAHIFRAFLQERFDKFSRGGGGWKGLRPSTLAARARKPGTRLRAALKRGDINEKQFAKRIKAAKRKQRKTTEAVMAAVVSGQLSARGGRITRKEQGAFQGSFSILRDVGLLYDVLAPTFSGAPGQLQEDIPFGVRVGFGGPARHPDGTATIADIASFHQIGGPHLPQRKIIVPPDEPTQKVMAGAMDTALKTIAGEA